MKICYIGTHDEPSKALKSFVKDMIVLLNMMKVQNLLKVLCRH